MATIEMKTFDFLSIMTGIMVLTFLGAATYSLIAAKITWAIYSAAIGSPTLALIAYWVGSKKT